jgi:hypothetical protein
MGGSVERNLVVRCPKGHGTGDRPHQAEDGTRRRSRHLSSIVRTPNSGLLKASRQPRPQPRRCPRTCTAYSVAESVSSL